MMFAVIIDSGNFSLPLVLLLAGGFSHSLGEDLTRRLAVNVIIIDVGNERLPGGAFAPEFLRVFNGH